MAGARIAAAIWAAIWNIRGDYYASLPGAYVETVNPTLWNSPDMKGAWGYHVQTYFHGPAQYLTLYPVAYLDSYAAIARVLLPIYAVLVAATFVLLRAAAGRLAPGAQMTVPLFASTFLFFPLLQSFIQREFEVVVCLGLSAALWLLLQDRRNAAAAVVCVRGVVQVRAAALPRLFRLAPLVEGRWRIRADVDRDPGASRTPCSAFRLFVNNNVPGHAAQVFNLWSYGFERQYELFSAPASARAGSRPRRPSPTFATACVRSAFAHGGCRRTSFTWSSVLPSPRATSSTHARFERVAERPADVERWRRALEFSIVTTVYSCFFFSHYYYLIVLIIPLSVLLTRYLAPPRSGRLVAWAIAYVLLSAFVIPTSVLTQLSGVDVWAAYIKGAWFIWGELLLMYLLLREYWDLSG